MGIYEEEKKEKLDDTWDFVKRLAEEVVIVAATTAVSIGVGILMKNMDD